MIAINADATIVPVGLRSTRELLPYGKVVPRRSPKPILVEFGPPITMDEFEGMPHKAKIAAITERIESEIRRLTNQPRPAVEVPPQPASQTTASQDVIGSS
jgi:1-acyl-sn-glycerol-3-phosphate acyltransferase